MQIKLSEKYEVLFNIPKGIEKVIITGGRNSQKSFATSLAVCYQMHTNGHRVLYTRYTLSSAEDSIIPEFNEKLDLLNYSTYYDTKKDRVTAKEGKQKIVFKGIKTSSGNQTAKLKSLKDFSMFILDEADEMPSFSDWDKIQKSIRATDVPNISINILNPTTKEHWIYQEFFEKKGIPAGFNGVHETTLYIHSTYLDMERELIPDNIWNEYETKRKDYEYYETLSPIQREICDVSIKQNSKYYQTVVLGGWLNKAEGVIYDNWEIGEFTEDIEPIYGLDFGSNDPDALTKVAVDIGNKIIYIEELYFKNDTSFEALRQVVEERVGFGPLIVADSEGRRMIRDLQDHGLNVVRCKKGQGSVKHRIKTIQSYKIIVSPKSINLHKALNNYRWHDSRSGVPNHDWSDLCDSFGYAAMDIIDNTTSSVGW